MIIKLLLIAGIGGAVVFALRGSNTGTNQALRRLGGLLFILVAAFSVLFPDSVTWLANLVNVKLGTNLVLYALVVAFMYVTVALYQRIHQLEEKLTELTRAVALSPHTPVDSDLNSSE